MHREDGVFWPLPRDVHGEVAAKLLDAGAAIVGFDILFTDPHWLSWAARRTHAPVDVPDGDQRFAELLSRHGNEIVLAAPPSPVAKNRFVPPLAEFTDRGPWVGHIAAVHDSDGIRRRSASCSSRIRGAGSSRWLPVLASRVRCKAMLIRLPPIASFRITMEAIFIRTSAPTTAAHR